jgi:ribosomal protein S18 acetylase RimI-like enzyme
MEGLTIRPATAADTERIAELIAGEPGQEAIGIAGCVEAARNFGMGFVRLQDGPQAWQQSALAEIDSRTVGVLQAGEGESPFKLSPRVAMLALRVFGVGIVSVLGRARARQRIQHQSPAGAYTIREFDVDPAYRNRRIGGTMLDHAEADARKQGYKLLSLTTTTNNPARRLYERHGYAVVSTLTDAAYERYTGIAGRHLMVKELS